ncbi:serine acetyltransferase [Elizabethkingia ursingii]|uniref:Serine acetyltransferase n=1 Tax=Elizabethkingia ursingii TaxID=1756150 RepID=A0AAJ3NAE1_9FLAO|nr:serine acetyltransferase [Elizabethkingia ursingii]AQX08203.1 serine acetyltransferase [Elizabethkingia ursingii]OPB73441.1 serine acetyltransferase [Elizabethkingia ursingii]
METKIKADLYRYYGVLNKRNFVKAWFLPGFRYTFFLRKSNHSKGLMNFFYRFFLRHYMIKYGIQIPFSTNIAEGLYIGHFGNIIINDNAIIGKNCNIAQGVTIGQVNRGKYIGAPVIGNEVWIGPNAVIVGSVNIGHNVLIAPNAYVNIDVPANSIVIGNPCKIIPNENATLGYINNKI